MKVLKFGGTSVGSAERMQNVVRLIADGESKIVVLSAMSGTTNSLIEFTNYLINGNINGAIISHRILLSRCVLMGLLYHSII